MSCFAGIDFDSEAVFVAFTDEDTGKMLGARTHDLACGPGNSFDRARRVRDLMPPRGSWADSGVLAIGIEATFSRSYAATSALARAQGAILACLPRDVDVYALSARAGVAKRGWKALTVGKTNASKDEVAAWAIANGAPAGLLQDLYDAFAIARAGALIHASRRRPAALTKGPV